MDFVQSKPHPLFLDKIKMDEIPTKIKWKKIHTLFTLGYFRKNQNGVEDMEFPRGIKEIACEISRGWPRKNYYVEFPGVLVFGLGISKGDVTQFCAISRVGALICLEFPEVK